MQKSFYYKFSILQVQSFLSTKYTTKFPSYKVLNIFSIREPKIDD
jgi:hypothetical protein